MAKIILKSDLTLGTNYQFNLVDFQGTDIAISNTLAQISSSVTDFTSSSLTLGINKRAIEVGDILTISNTDNNANEGMVVTVDTVAANLIEYTLTSGTPADESAGAAMNITAFKKTFEFIAAGGLSFVDGVAAITWASEVVDQWDTGDLDIYDKMFTSIEPRAKSLACLNGWEPEDANTLNALRDMALEIRDTATSAAKRIYACPRSGNLDETSDQFYYWPASDAELTAPTAAVTTGYINQLILIYDLAGSDDRGDWTFRCLEPGKTHLQETIDIQYAEIVPIGSGNGIDPKLADGGGTLLVSDATVGAGGIYANILLNIDVDSQYDFTVDGTIRSFVGFIDADSQTNEDVHIKIHYLLRQAVDINNDGTGPDVRGDKAPPITFFLGEVFTVDQYALENYSTIQRNELRLIDDTDVERSWPSIFTLSITAPANAVAGTFSVMHEDTFGASAPTYLQDETPTDQQDITIASTVNIVIAYSTYAVDGHPPNTPIPLRLSWNRPGFIEPDNLAFTMAAANQTVAISPTSDPSYSAT
jgi:hypothetical protein